MKVFVLGGRGMLGQALCREGGARRNYTVVSCDLVDANFCFDIRNDRELASVVGTERPDVIINTVGIVDLAWCEENPGDAYCINARPVSVLARLSQTYGFYLIHISTDHFYLGDADKKHTERDLVSCFNEYGRTKYIAELFVRQIPQSLIVRTNIVGFRNEDSRPTFVEWIISTLKRNEQITGFVDVYTSSIDVIHCASVIYDLIEQNVTGILNVASRDVTCKKDFIVALTKELGEDVSLIKSGSMQRVTNKICRGDSMGLDVRRAEEILGYSLPSLSEVISTLTREYLTKEAKKKGS